MNKIKRITLKEARVKGLEKFIREHEHDEPGDFERLDKTIKHPVSQKSKVVPKASSRDNHDD